jgi:hypothetical protein
MDKVLNDLYEKFGHHPLFAKLRRVDIKDSPIYKKGAELADDIRDKYETSDHPAVHKVEVSPTCFQQLSMLFMRVWLFSFSGQRQLHQVVHLLHRVLGYRLTSQEPTQQGGS